MNRRCFLMLVTGTLTASRVADAQAPTPMFLVGLLTAGSSGPFRDRLRDLGYVEGRNVVFEVRATQGRTDRADALAGELVRLKVDVIVATNPTNVFAARRATDTIPIVMVYTPDPVRLGLVTSLARPGGNITGVTSLSIDLSVKQLQLLREAVPRAARLAMLWNPDNPWHPHVVQALRADERALGVPLGVLPIRTPEEFEAAFRAMVRDRVGAALVLADPTTFLHRRRLADLATGHRIPLMGGLRSYAEAGCLMSYWADEGDLLLRAATYVDRILKGARPGDLPIEQPTKFELVLNLRTARALGLALPPPLLARADHIIQ